MRHLRTLTNAGVFDLDEGAHLRASSKLRARPQVGVGPHARTLSDAGTIKRAAADGGAIADIAAHDHRPLTDQAVATNDRAGAQLHARLDHGVLADQDVGIHQHAGGIQEGDAVLGMGAQQSLASDPGHLRKLPAVVDSEHHLPVGGRHRADLATAIAQHGQHIREVALALRILGADPARAPAQGAPPRRRTRLR